jgi:mono/diheme cytochrome c family protein
VCTQTLVTWARKGGLSLLAAVVLAAGGLVACNGETRRKSDQELGLTTEQARGRRVYEAKCEACHDPYSGNGRNGPSLRGIYRKPYLPSGIPANDERVSEIIVSGKSKMPGLGTSISEAQLQDLLTYLKTL